jgi:hypothetical protein
MRHVFERLDLKKKVPRPQAPKADPARQEAWKKRGLKDKLTQAQRLHAQAPGARPARAVCFGDEMRVGLIGQVRRRWVPCGMKLRQAVEFVRVWAYLNLAVDPLTGRLWWEWTPNMKAVSISSVLASWQEDIGTLVWDGAPGHKSKAYEEVDIVRIEQPPYAPEVQPSERVFHYLRDRIEGKVYGSLEAKKEAVERELEALAANPEAVRRLTCWDWIEEALTHPLVE